MKDEFLRDESLQAPKYPIPLLNPTLWHIGLGPYNAWDWIHPQLGPDAFLRES